MAAEANGGPEPNDGLYDEEGPIPTFGPVPVDEHGRIALSEEEQSARRSALIRALRVIGEPRGKPDPPEVHAAVMRLAGLDPEGNPLEESQ